MAERCHKIARNRPRDKIHKTWRVGNIQGCRLCFRNPEKGGRTGSLQNSPFFHVLSGQAFCPKIT